MVKINNRGADVAADIDNHRWSETLGHIVFGLFAWPEQHLIDREWITGAGPIKNILPAPMQLAQRWCRGRIEHRLGMHHVMGESPGARAGQDPDHAAKTKGRHKRLTVAVIAQAGVAAQYSCPL